MTAGDRSEAKDVHAPGCRAAHYSGTPCRPARAKAVDADPGPCPPTGAQSVYGVDLDEVAALVARIATRGRQDRRPRLFGEWAALWPEYITADVPKVNPGPPPTNLRQDSDPTSSIRRDRWLSPAQRAHAARAAHAKAIDAAPWTAARTAAGIGPDGITGPARRWHIGTPTPAPGTDQTDPLAWGPWTAADILAGPDHIRAQLAAQQAAQQAAQDDGDGQHAPTPDTWNRNTYTVRREAAAMRPVGPQLDAFTRPPIGAPDPSPFPVDASELHPAGQPTYFAALAATPQIHPTRAVPPGTIVLGDLDDTTDGRPVRHVFAQPTAARLPRWVVDQYAAPTWADRLDAVAFPTAGDVLGYLHPRPLDAATLTRLLHVGTGHTERDRIRARAWSGCTCAAPWWPTGRHAPLCPVQLAQDRADAAEAAYWQDQADDHTERHAEQRGACLARTCRRPDRPCAGRCPLETHP